MKFTTHPSGIAIGSKSKIRGWRPEKFKEAKAEYNLTILRQWQKTFEQVEQEQLMEV